MADSEMKMTYSAILHDGSDRKIVRVSFERKGSTGNELAEGVLPDAKITKQNGYSDEEVSGLEQYLKENADDIMAKAKLISNPLKWL